MVQTEVCTSHHNDIIITSLLYLQSQYVFLHDAILEGVTTGWTDFTVEQLPERMAELEEVNEEGESGYYTEFNVSSTHIACV